MSAPGDRVSLTPGDRGAMNLMDKSNFVYIKNVTKGNRIIWKCKKFK